MERRVLLAITLSFAVLYVYQAFLVPPPPADSGNRPAATALTLPVRAGTAPGNLTAAAPTAVLLTAPVVGDTTEREIVLETAHVRGTFTNRGARLRHWVLKNYRNERGEPINLIPEVTSPDQALPFALRVDDPAVTARLNDTPYQVTGPQDQTISFALETTEGLKVRKSFTLDPQTFVVSFSASVTLNGQELNPTVAWGPGMTDEIARTTQGSFLSPSYVYQAQAIYHTGSDVEREAASAIPGGTIHEGSYRWAGIDDHYFISAVLQPPGRLRVEYQPVTIPTPASPPTLGRYMTYALRFNAAPENVRFYVGPKQLNVMRDIDPEFTRAIYFGMFAVLAAPLLEALRWVHGYVGDWGWSIIVLTILINLVMFPLRHKSVVSMRKMQEIQPQMKAIQERYAKYKITDPERQKMNSEVMDLYRARGVNPASGCVPTLLTLPFLFAFYAMLGQAIEIRGERFWWIPDLAVQDPLFLMPALMGVSMFWQQKMTPTSADPTQQKIMMFMPVMITVTMLFAPSGLVIYWLVSNIWTIGQQYFTNWLIGPTRSAAAAVKKSGLAKVGHPFDKAQGKPPDIVVPSTRGKK